MKKLILTLPASEKLGPGALIVMDNEYVKRAPSNKHGACGDFDGVCLTEAKEKGDYVEVVI